MDPYEYIYIYGISTEVTHLVASLLAAAFLAPNVSLTSYVQSSPTGGPLDTEGLSDIILPYTRMSTSPKLTLRS